jgi:hypothetical protein
MAKTKTKRTRKEKPALDDRWIKDWSVIDPAKEHALGVLTLAWTSCEIQMLALFIMLAQLDPRQGWIIAHDLGNIAIAERVLETAKYRLEQNQLPQEAFAGLKQTLRAYDVVRQNRNTFTHSKTVTTPAGAREVVRMKGPSMYREPLPNDLEAFRRVAIDTRRLAAHLREMWEYVEQLNKGKAAAAPTSLSVPELVWKPHHVRT